MNEKLHKLYIAAIFEAEKQDLTEEGLADVAARIEYPKTQVLEILRLMDFDKASVKYKGIKFAKEPARVPSQSTAQPTPSSNRPSAC